MTAIIKFLLAGMLMVSLVSCSEAQPSAVAGKVVDNYKPVYTVSGLNNRFELAARQPSTDSMTQIFIDWNRNIAPNTIEFIRQDDTISAVFEVYKAFYQPLDLLKLGNWEWGNKLNSNSKYVVIQNRIYFSVIPENKFDNYSWQSPGKSSIDNFRPPLNIDKTKVLYLTDEYDQSLLQFLGTKSTELGTPDIMSPSRPAGESEHRYEMIRPFIPVLHGHWGGYWHLATHPDVEIILFNKTLTKARINFRVGYQGGEATLVKTNNKWVIAKSNATWIE